MNAALMRFLDNTVGRVGCCLLAAMHRLRPRRAAPDPDLPIRRVLVIKLIGLGTILLSSALTRGLRRSLPGLRLDYLTLDGFGPAVAMTGTAGHIYSLNLRAPIRSVLRTIRALRANRYDVVVDLDYFACASLILACLTGARRLAGFVAQGRGQWGLLTDTAQYALDRHILDMYADLAGLLTGAEQLPPPALSLDEDTMRRGRQILDQAGLTSDQPLVLINPNVSAFSVAMRRWEPSKFAALADRCRTELGVQVAFIGSGAEAEHVASIMAMMQSGAQAVSLAGRTSLTELGAVISLADCLVSCDTGPLLMAMTAGTPTVALLGPTAWTHRPVGQRDRIICKRLDCSPCLTVFNQKSARCVYPTNLCMTQIEVDEVQQAVAEVLAAAVRPQVAGNSDLPA